MILRKSLSGPSDAEQSSWGLASLFSFSPWIFEMFKIFISWETLKIYVLNNYWYKPDEMFDGRKTSLDTTRSKKLLHLITSIWRSWIMMITNRDDQSVSQSVSRFFIRASLMIMIMKWLWSETNLPSLHPSGTLWLVDCPEGSPYGGWLSTRWE